jgi:hypothetical protein
VLVELVQVLVAGVGFERQRAEGHEVDHLLPHVERILGVAAAAARASVAPASRKVLRPAGAAGGERTMLVRRERVRPSRSRSRTRRGLYLTPYQGAWWSPRRGWSSEVDGAKQQDPKAPLAA